MKIESSMSSFTPKSKPDCPACTNSRLHTVREWRDHHSHAGNGYVEGQGWTTPETPAEESPVVSQPASAS